LKLLLDTHVLIWMSIAPDRLSGKAARLLMEAEFLCVSVVSGWEYGMKRRRHPEQFLADFDSLLAGLDFRPLGMPFELHRYAEQLPPIHQDPFDRMLIAQAIDQELTLVTADKLIRRYPVETLW
jgi:PIN domain nuclease of toxin-antitoxin system